MAPWDAKKSEGLAVLLVVKGVSQQSLGKSFGIAPDEGNYGVACLDVSQHLHHLRYDHPTPLGYLCVCRVFAVC